MLSDKNFRQEITDEMVSLMILGTDEGFAKAQTLAWVLNKLAEEYPTLIHKNIQVQINGKDFMRSNEVYMTTGPGELTSINIHADNTEPFNNLGTTARDSDYHFTF